MAAFPSLARGPSASCSDKLGDPEVETQEPITCFSPERRFEAKERRERPPRRYDKVEQEIKGVVVKEIG